MYDFMLTILYHLFLPNICKLHCVGGRVGRIGSTQGVQETLLTQGNRLPCMIESFSED